VGLGAIVLPAAGPMATVCRHGHVTHFAQLDNSLSQLFEHVHRFSNDDFRLVSQSRSILLPFISFLATTTTTKHALGRTRVRLRSQ